MDKGQFDQNKPYDQFVREVVAASGEVDQHPPVAWYREVKTVQNQLEDVSQLFLGTRIQCAQCHHHPFEKWSQEDYYKLSAFFSQVGREKTRFPDEEIIFHKRGVAKATNKKNNQPVEPAGLGADSPELTVDDDPRHALVDWMSKDGNPFFSHTLVNRYWKHFSARSGRPRGRHARDQPFGQPRVVGGTRFHLRRQQIRHEAIDPGHMPVENLPVQLHPQRLQRKDKHNFAGIIPSVCRRRFCSIRLTT